MEQRNRSWLLSRLTGFADKTALIGNDQHYTFRHIGDQVLLWQHEFKPYSLTGAVVIVNGDFSARAISALLAIYIQQGILVPLHQASVEKTAQVAKVVGADYVLDLTSDERLQPSSASREKHPLVTRLTQQAESGLILLSSGSTGEPKAMLLSLDRLLEKHRTNTRFQASVTAAFLLFDHIGGFNTLVHCLCHGGTLVHLPMKDPSSVCQQIERHGIELLPTTPTFLNMLLISQAWQQFDLSSLKLMTYGTEVMPKQTLVSIARLFPQVRLKQTYGMSELGILATRSEANDSLWLKIGGEGVEVKVVDGVLWIKSSTAMLGYLNALSPFDDDGWLCTNDMVEVSGDYFRVLGRRQEIINVAGLKVLPVEVEEQILALPFVEEVVVWPKKNPVTGFVVAATVTLRAGMPAEEAKARILAYCQRHLEAWQVPKFITFDSQPKVSERFKKIRAKSNWYDANS